MPPPRGRPGAGLEEGRGGDRGPGAGGAVVEAPAAYQGGEAGGAGGKDRGGGEAARADGRGRRGRARRNPAATVHITAPPRLPVGKRKVLNESALKHIRLPEQGEMLGRVIKLLGSDQVLVKCTDGITRRGRIRGKLKRRIWIRDNDIVVIAPWDFKAAERGDIVWRFTLPQVDWLKDNDHLARDF